MKENQTDTTGTAENIQLADPEATKDTETENTGPDPRTDDKDGIEDTRHDGAARENGDTRRGTGQQKETDGTRRRADRRADAKSKWQKKRLATATTARDQKGLEAARAAARHQSQIGHNTKCCEAKPDDTT